MAQCESGNTGYELRETAYAEGVGLFATKAFGELDVVFEEIPIVSAQFCWNEAYGYYACHHCLRPMESVEENVRRLTGNANIEVPQPELCPTVKSNHRFCESCGVGFCSETCLLAADQQYHRMLCSAQLPALMRLVEVWKKMHYPPETTSITLIVRIIAIIERSDDRDHFLQILMSFSHGTTNSTEDLSFLEGDEGEAKIKQLSAVMKEVLPVKHAQQFLTEEGLRTLFALVGRNGQGIGTSVYSKWIEAIYKPKDLSDKSRAILDSFTDSTYENMDKHVGTFLNCEGSGLYKLQRSINHSCDPNAYITFPYSDHRLVLVAAQAIEPGEEITISYEDECTASRSRHSRNKILKKYYLFECKCPKCLAQADQPDVTSEEETDSDDMETSDNESQR